MEARHRYRVLHRSALVELGDLRCAHDERTFGPEEHARRHEIAFVRRGAFACRFGREETLLDANRLLLLNRGEPYRVRHPLAGGDACTLLRWSDEALQELARAADPRAEERPERPFARPSAGADSALFLAQRDLLAHCATGAPDPLFVDERALALGAAALRSAARAPRPAHRATPRTRTRHRELVEAARALLAARFHRRLPLAALAFELDTSPFHLARIFRAETGVTLHRYQTRLRLRAALEPLAEGRRSATEVAHAVGFSSASHFSTAFRAEFGRPPSRWRARS